MLKRIIVKSNDLSLGNLNSELAYLKHFSEPVDLHERSYYQYRCQMKQHSKLLEFLQNMGATLLFPIYFVYLLAMRVEKERAGLKNAVFFTSGISIDTLPQELTEHFDYIHMVSFGEKMVLKKRELCFILRLFLRYWYAPYFLFKSMLKVAMYANAYYRYAPDCIISYSEYSYTSSLLTSYCRSLNIEHVNIMHGEKLLNIRDSFVAFDRFYIWDEFYKKLFLELQAEASQFVVAEPKTIHLNVTNDSFLYEFTYYLTSESCEHLMRIKNILLMLKVPKEKICLRLHPRYSNKEDVRRIAGDFILEYPDEISITESLSRTRNAISLYSTVLFQAYKCNRNVIIDNLSNAETYESLKAYKYIMMNKDHHLLSEYISHEYA